MYQPLTPDQIRRIRGEDTQPEFALTLGHPALVTTISRWENGHVKPSRVYDRILRQAAQSRGITL